jgi:phosphoglycolate phosphatase-like HAD superfamily hydrolase
MIRFPDISDELSNKRLFIFDFDETLVNLNLDWTQLKKELSITVKERFDIDMSFTPIMEKMEFLRTKIDDGQFLLISNLVKQWELSALQHNSTIQPVGYSLLKHIHQNLIENSKIKRYIAILSNNFTDVIKKGAEQYNFAQYVSCYVGRDLVEKIKPHPEGINKIHNQFPSIRKTEIVYFGDSSIYDRKVAESYGITFFLITHPE